MKTRLCLTLLALLGPSAAFAWGDGCEYRAERAGGVDAAGVEKVIIRTGAGDMKIVGRTNAVRIEARGVACASKQELLDATRISVRREGTTVIVETDLPQDNQSGWNLGGNKYAYIDIGIALPSSIPVEAQDSSGDVVIEDLAALKLQDSSGDIEINRIAGPVDVQDSSGDIEIEDTGDIRLSDSSGDIDVERVKGSVLVDNDSSGDIEITDVSRDVHIVNDSSGGIRVDDVRGSVLVENDSSGDIFAGRVGGDFTVRADTSGSISHEAIGGRISVPDNKRDDVE